MSSEHRSLIKYWPFGVGILTTVGVAWFAAREFDWRSVWASLAGADPRYLALAVTAMLLNIALKAGRWQWLFHPMTEQLRRRDLLSALLIGQLGNVLLPARLGDVARMGLVHRKSRVALSLVLLTILAEKAFDSVMLLVLLGALLPFVAWPNWMNGTKLVAGLLLSAGLALLIWTSTRERVRQRVVQALQHFVPGPIPGWVQRALQSLDAWRVMQDRQVQVRLWASSAAIWLLAGLVNYFGFRAVALDLPLTAGLLLAATEIAGTQVAYTPAGIGVYHSIAILTLAPFGVGPTDALSAALLLHLIVFVPIICGGLAAVWLDGVSWRQ